MTSQTQAQRVIAEAQHAAAEATPQQVIGNMLDDAGGRNHVIFMATPDVNGGVMHMAFSSAFQDMCSPKVQKWMLNAMIESLVAYRADLE